MESSIREPLLTASEPAGPSGRPVLGHAHGGDPELQHPELQLEQAPSGQDSFSLVCLNLTKVILGAGMMVIPKALLLLGIVVGSISLAVVAVMTWFTISWLVYAAEKTGKRTYASVVNACCGPTAKWILLLAIFANCLGLCIVFLVILGDILLGAAPDYTGLLHQLLPTLDPFAWYMQRWFVLSVITGGILTPLAATADLARLGPLSTVGNASVLGLAGTMVALAVAAVAKGGAYKLPLWPDWAALGDGRRGDGNAALFFAMIGTVPVLLNAYVCHQSVFPIMTLLKPYTRKRMNGAVAISLASCNAVYLTIAFAALIVFGPYVDDDVLNNLSVEDMSPLLGHPTAHTAAALVRVGYAISLIGSFLLMLYALKLCVLEMILRKRFGLLPMPGQHWLSHPLTAILLFIIWAVAVYVPSIWSMLSLVGSLAATVMAFLVPSLITLRKMRKPKWKHRTQVAAACIVASIGMLLFVSGVFSMV